MFVEDVTLELQAGEEGVAFSIKIHEGHLEFRTKLLGEALLEVREGDGWHDHLEDANIR